MEQFKTGAVRDTSTHKPDLSIIDSDWLIAVLTFVKEDTYTMTEWYTEYLYNHLIQVRAHPNWLIEHWLLHTAHMCLVSEYGKTITFTHNNLLRLGNLLTIKAEHYGRDNWRQGMPLSRTYQSLLRHTSQLGYEAQRLYEDMYTEDNTVRLTDAYNAILSTPYTEYSLLNPRATFTPDDDHVAAILANLMFMWHSLTLDDSLNDLHEV